MFNKLPTINPEPEPLNIEDKPRKIDKSNKAMKIYLEKVTQYRKLKFTFKIRFIRNY